MRTARPPFLIGLLVTLAFSCTDTAHQKIEAEALIGAWELKEIVLSDARKSPEMKQFAELEKRQTLDAGLLLTLGPNGEGAHEVAGISESLGWRVGERQDTVFLLSPDWSAPIYLTDVEASEEVLLLDYLDNGRYVFKRVSGSSTAERVVAPAADNAPSQGEPQFVANCEQPPLAELPATKKVVVVYLSENGDGTPYPGSPDLQLLDVLNHSVQFQALLSPDIQAITYGTSCPHSQRVMKQFDVSSVPTLLVLNERNELLLKSIGVLSEGELVRRLSRALGER